MPSPDLAIDPASNRPISSARDRLTGELRAGEQLVWTSSPDAFWLRLVLIAVSLFSLAGVGYLVFLAIQGISSGWTPAVGVFRRGVSVWFLGLMGLAGLILAGSFALEFRRPRRTAYAVSNRRALVVEPQFPAGFQIRSLAPRRLAAILDGEPPADDPRTLHDVFRVDDIRHVEGLIRSTLLTPSGDGPPTPAEPTPGPEPKPPITPGADPEFTAPTPRPGARLAGELADGEKVAWSGRPRATRILAQSPALAVAPCLVGVWLILGSIAIETGNPAILLGPIILSGLAVWAFRLSLRQLLAAGTTEYLLTDRRALVRTAGREGGATVESFAPDDLGELLRRERPDGAGDLVFAEVFGPNRRYGPVACRGFLGVDDVRAVEALVRSTLLDGRRDALTGGLT